MNPIRLITALCLVAVFAVPVAASASQTDALSSDKAAFLATVDRQLRKKFKRRCGVRAELERPDALVVVVDKKKRSKKKFLTRKSPSGERVTILCDGRVVSRARGEKAVTVQPKTRADVNKEMMFKGCVNTCQESHAVCDGVDLGVRSEAAHLCRANCVARCE